MTCHTIRKQTLSVFTYKVPDCMQYIVVIYVYTDNSVFMYIVYYYIFKTGIIL